MRTRTNRICIQLVIDEIELAYNRMESEIRHIIYIDGLPYKEAKRLWILRNPQVDLQIFR